VSRDGALTLADHPGPMVRLRCRKCDRIGRYRLARLIAVYGSDAKLPDLRHRLAKCPRTLLNHWPVSESDPCG
jgi:hypothetical protein